MTQQRLRRVSDTGDPAWDRLKTGDTYKIYRDPTQRWNPFRFRYTVARPEGGVLAVAASLWGARYAVRREIKRLDGGKKRYFWERPLVDEIPASSKGGSR